MHELRGAAEPTVSRTAAKTVAGRPCHRRRMEGRAVRQDRSVSRRQSASRRCIRTILMSSPLPPTCAFPQARCRSSSSTTSTLSSMMLLAKAADVCHAASSAVSGVRDGAAHRRLLCVLRSADADRGYGAADRERVTPVAERENVPLRDARGRVLAADVVSRVNVPPFDNSAVDGYAVRSADLDAEGETRLQDRRSRHGRSRAGAPARPRRGDAHLHRRAGAGWRRHDLHAGGCAGRRVAMSSSCRRASSAAPISAVAGEDVKAGATILPAGRRLAAAARCARPPRSG